MLLHGVHTGECPHGPEHEPKRTLRHHRELLLVSNVFGTERNGGNGSDKRSAGAVGYATPVGSNHARRPHSTWTRRSPDPCHPLYRSRRPTSAWPRFQVEGCEPVRESHPRLRLGSGRLKGARNTVPSEAGPARYTGLTLGPIPLWQIAARHRSRACVADRSVVAEVGTIRRCVHVPRAARG